MSKPKVIEEEKTLILPWPFEKDYKMSSPFGIVRSHKSKSGVIITRPHDGVDYAVPERTTVKALAPGFAYRVGWENEENPDQGFGYRVIQKATIDGKLFGLWYTHLAWSYVHEGYDLKVGDEVGMTGNTGDSSGPHIHFQAREWDTGNYYDIRFYGRPDA